MSDKIDPEKMAEALRRQADKLGEAQQAALDQLTQKDGRLASQEHGRHTPLINERLHKAASLEEEAKKMERASKVLRTENPDLAAEFADNARQSRNTARDLKNSAKPFVDERKALEAERRQVAGRFEEAKNKRNLAARILGGERKDATPAVGADPVEAPATAAPVAEAPVTPATPPVTPAAEAPTATPPAAEAGAAPAAGAGAAVAAEGAKEVAEAVKKISFGETLKKAGTGTFTATEWEKDIGKTKRVVGRLRANFAHAGPAGKIGRGIGLGAVIVAGGKGVVDMGSFIGEKIGMLDPKTDPNTGKPVPADMGKFIVAASELGGAALGTYLLARGGAAKAMTAPGQAI